MSHLLFFLPTNIITIKCIEKKNFYVIWQKTLTCLREFFRATQGVSDSSTVKVCVFPSGWPNGRESLRGLDALSELAGASRKEVPHANTCL